jgi:deoxyribodipyrimidine photo-lyase
MQMQSGTTGINVTRVYNPVKQAQDHDPHGHFVRRWLPYMRYVPEHWRYEPWLMPDGEAQRIRQQCGMDIPLPLVDLHEATREAKERLYAVRRKDTTRADVARVVKKHGSRRKSARKRENVQEPSPQLGFDF